jgi:hypothetical protein
MEIGGTLEAATDWVLLCLPWLLLALAAWRSARPRCRDLPHRASAAVMERVSQDAAPAVPAQPEGKEDLVPPTPAVIEPAPADREERLILAIAEAKASHDDAGLSGLSVELARLMIARSASQQAALQLQSAVIAARRSNLPALHAEARIELAELAIRDGDLTLACEHWQMAKLMFHETNNRLDRDRIADLMRQHRCPTDWVLTNF